MRMAFGLRWTVCGVAVLALGACSGDDSSGSGSSAVATLLAGVPDPGATAASSSSGAGGTDSTVAGGDSAVAGGSTAPGGNPASSDASVSSGADGNPEASGGSTGSTPGSGTSGAGEPPGGTSSPSSPATTRPPEPTGVPGATSAQPMCRDYATVVGSQSLLTIAGAFGNVDAPALARLELISAPAVVASAEALTSEWPAALASEQASVESGVVGPIVARARQALDAVKAAGIDQDTLRMAWRITLTTYDPANPPVTVSGFTADTEAQLADAAASYAAGVPRYDQDPSVRRTADTPLTTQFLFAECPELSYLITGDAD